MRILKKELQAVAKELKTLTRKTESIMKAVDKLEKTKAATKGKAKAVKKTAAKKKPAKKKVVAKKTSAKKKVAAKKGGVTATDKVLNIIKRAKKGADVPALMRRTGFDEKKVRNIVGRAFKQKKIKRSGRGIYVGA